MLEHIGFRIGPILNTVGGKGGIRTLEELSLLPLFESGAFDHSATFP